MNRPITAAAGAALMAALALAAPAPAAGLEEVVERTIALAPGGSFTLANVNGAVDIEGWDRSEVHIRAVKTAHAQRAELGRVHIDVLSSPDAVAVFTRYPEGDGVEASVDYHIRVPRGARLGAIQTVNGNIRIREVEGPAAVRAVNGDLQLSGVHGRVEARTTNGSVFFEAPGPRPAAAITLETINGSIVLGLPAGAHADLEVVTTNGDFRSELPLEVYGAGEQREFRGRLGRGGSPVRLRTVNGAVRVVLSRRAV